MSNLSDSEGVGFLALATGSLRDDELGTLDVCRDLAVARSRVLLACHFGLARFRERTRWIRTLRWMWTTRWVWMTSSGVLRAAGLLVLLGRRPRRQLELNVGIGTDVVRGTGWQIHWGAYGRLPRCDIDVSMRGVVEIVVVGFISAGPILLVLPRMDRIHNGGRWNGR